jgi:hypothetical protein
VVDVSTVGVLRRGLARLAVNPSRAIYGGIVATAVIVAASSHDEPMLAVAAATALTVVVFWIAHVYSAVLEHRYHGNRLRLRDVRRIMSEELPMVEAAVLPIVVLLVGAFDQVSDQAATNVALAAGVAQLLVWGAVAARRAGWSWPATLGASAIDGVLGLLVIGLKSILH